MMSADDKTFYEQHLAEGRNGDFTPAITRHLIISAVNVAAQQVYDDTYPIRCAQTANAIRLLLSDAGISAHLCAGAVCFLKLDLEGQPCGWTGFWGQDHHIWVETQYGELVDLNICRLHDHPLTSLPELPVPAFWVDMDHFQPAFFRYLPDTIFGAVKFEGQDEDDHQNLIRLARQTFEDMESRLSPAEFECLRLVTSFDDLARRADQGDPYLRGVEGLDVDPNMFPHWIIDRTRELMDAYADGKNAPSRLTDIPNLFCGL